jgi:hypothetical protein
MSRPLRSTPTPASRSFTATTSRSASERRIGTQRLQVCYLGALPLATYGPTTPIAVSTLAFSRSVQEPQTRLTPPKRRTPPGQYTGTRQAHHEDRRQTLAFDAIQTFRRVNSDTHQDDPASDSGTSSWSPPDAMPPQPRLFPNPSPRRSSANAAQGGLAPSPVERRRRASNPPSLAQHRL